MNTLSFLAKIGGCATNGKLFASHFGASCAVAAVVNMVGRKVFEPEDRSTSEICIVVSSLLAGCAVSILALPTTPLAKFSEFQLMAWLTPFSLVSGMLGLAFPPSRAVTPLIACTGPLIGYLGPHSLYAVGAVGAYAGALFVREAYDYLSE
jgi:hypothetical protein